MKRIVLSGIAFTAALCATIAFAQTPATSLATPSTPGQSGTQAITMSGCVASGAGGSEGFVLSNPIVLPSTGSSITASSSATTGGSTASGATTQPPVSSPPPTSAPPTATPPTSATPPAAVGTSGASAAQPTGTTGAAASAAASPSSSAFNGYRLSGADMAQWSGKRVEVTGMFAPSSAASSAASASSAGSTAMKEFRVVSIKPVTGSCPQE